MRPRQTGGCACGAVRYHVHGPLRDVIDCHCSDCRHATGHHAAMTAAARDDVEVTGEVRWWDSTPGTRRGFCSTCGSPLFWDAVGRNRLWIHAGSLDLPTGLKTRGHVFVADMSDYYAITDGLPQRLGDDEELSA